MRVYQALSTFGVRQQGQFDSFGFGRSRNSGKASRSAAMANGVAVLRRNRDSLCCLSRSARSVSAEGCWYHSVNSLRAKSWVGTVSNKATITIAITSKTHRTRYHLRFIFSLQPLPAPIIPSISWRHQLGAESGPVRSGEGRQLSDYRITGSGPHFSD